MVKRVGVLEETAIANVKKMIESHKPELQAAFEKRDPEKRGWYVSTRQRCLVLAPCDAMAMCSGHTR